MVQPLESLTISVVTFSCVGKILGVKTASPEVFWVKFPGDPQKYFFQGKDVRSWLVEPKVLKPDGAGEKSTASQLPGTKRSSEPVTSPHKKNKQEAGILQIQAEVKLCSMEVNQTEYEHYCNACSDG